MKLVISFGLIAAFVVGCSQPSEVQRDAKVGQPDAELPRFVRFTIRNENALQALAQGRLSIDPQGCLRIGSNSGPFVIWHHDSRIERAADGRIKITDGNTGNSAYIGDEVAMGGGQADVAPTNVSEPVPSACAGQGFWIAGQLFTEAERQRVLQRERTRHAAPGPQSRTR